MADFCYGPLVSAKSKIPNILPGDKNGRILAGANYESYASEVVLDSPSV